MCFSLHSDCHRSMTLLPSPIASNASPLSQTIPPMEGSHLYFSSSTPQSHFLSSAVFLPSFILLSFVWICIFLLGGQGLLPTLSWCSVRSPASEDVFLMHPWREDYSPSSCSSTILSSSRIAIVEFLTLSTRKIFMTIPEQYLCVHTCVHEDFQKFTQMVIHKNRSLAFFPP